MPETIEIRYLYRFEGGSEKAFDILIDKETLRFCGENNPSPPDWARLQSHKCENCTLDPAKHDYCPVALNLVEIAEGFKDYFAYEKVEVTVTAPERQYYKQTSIQEGLSSLLGIIMVTSGCPVMEPLKPMVRFHLPFATLIETIFRTVSTYLLAQYFIHKDGLGPNWDINAIQDIYAEVGTLNRDFLDRLNAAAKKDANANALVNLDFFAAMLPLSLEDIMAEIRSYFTAYLKKPS